MEELNLRYLYALISLFLLLAANAAAGSFTANMDVNTYVNANNVNQSYEGSSLLWVTSVNGSPVNETYLSFVNLFGSQSIFNSGQIKSATLTLNAAKVNKTGMVTAYFLHGATFDNANWNDKGEYDTNVTSTPVAIEKEGNYVLDVTPIIRKAVETCTEGCPYTIVLVAEDEASVGFTSSKASSENKPTLEYTTEE
jgi:hypothetical protein